VSVAEFDAARLAALGRFVLEAELGPPPSARAATLLVEAFLRRGAPGRSSASGSSRLSLDGGPLLVVPSSKQS
jgi:hypothetical protein